MTAEISHEEYESRQNKARNLMTQGGLQALLITDPTNLNYFSGASYFGEMSYPRPAALLIPRDAEARLLTHAFHLAIPWQGDVREYQKVGELPVEILKDLMAQAACESGRIGMELGREQRLGMSYRDFVKVQDALPRAAFVDSADLIWQIRMQKSATEIAVIQRTCEIHDAIFKKVFGSVKAGMTTYEIDRLFRVAIAESEADSGWTVVCVGDFDESQASGSTHPAKVLEAEDLLWVDLGVVLQGYHSDYCRGLVLGALTEAREKLWNQVQEVLVAGMETVEPGVPVSMYIRPRSGKPKHWVSICKPGRRADSGTAAVCTPRNRRTSAGMIILF